MILKRMMKYRGLFVIVLWQAAPTQYGLGFGRSSIDELIITGGGCEPMSPPPVEHRKNHRPTSVGATLSNYSPKLRVSLGLAYSTGDTTTISGLQARGVLAGEWKYFGLGTGFVVDQAEPLPGFYLRAGPLSGLHLRVDMPDLSLPVSSTGVGRAGVAWNQSPTGGIGAFIGVPVCYLTCTYGAGGPRVDLRLPLARGINVTMSGFTHSDYDDLDYWGVAIAASISSASRGPRDSHSSPFGVTR